MSDVKLPKRKGAAIVSIGALNSLPSGTLGILELYGEEKAYLLLKTGEGDSPWEVVDFTGTEQYWTANAIVKRGVVRVA